MFKKWNVPEGSLSLINSISIEVFWSRNSRRGVGVKLPPSFFSLDKELPFIDLKLDTHTKQLKIFQKSKRNFWIWHDTFNWSHHISAFSAGNLTSTYFCYFATLALFFLYFSAFCEFQCPFCKNTFALT